MSRNIRASVGTEGCSVEFRRIDDASEFRERALPLLMAGEAENNLLIGLTLRLAADAEEGKTAPDARPLMAVVEDGGRVSAAVLQTPPRNLIVSNATPRAMKFIARELHAAGYELPGVIGPDSAAESLAIAWTALTGQAVKLHMRERVYRLDQVILPPAVPGEAVQATEADKDLALRWATAFSSEALHDMDDCRPMVESQLADGRLFFWRNPEPVSMAASVRPTPHGMAIAPVYTPPERRRKGYATALVAKLSQRQLDAGKEFCCLFADMANPTSNSIYQKIGYRALCDFMVLGFVMPA
ncbi:MAG: GNAT family N-acetyltransferase [Phycisphaerae bacterium]|nr:GNAT family N-acetyltransferase [Phycisphaerae bacterium]